jgi:dipeptidyl aminopeptidase/acylaminoacyl peptidase
MRAESDARSSSIRLRGVAAVLSATFLTALLLPGAGSAASGEGRARQAQPAAKKVLGIDDYERWRQITEPTISDTGTWVAYGYRRPNAHDPKLALHIKSLRADAEFELLDASGPRFSGDTWIAYFVDLPYDEAEELQRQGEPRPRKVQLLNLVSGERLTWDNATAFQFSAGGEFLAVKKAPADRNAGHQGSDLVLRALEASTEQLIGSVHGFAFDQQPGDDDKQSRPDRPAQRLAYTVDAADQTGNGIYLIDLDSGVLRPLDNDARTYSRLTWSRDGQALAVLKGNAPEGQAERLNILLAFRHPAAAANNTETRLPSVLDPRFVDAFPATMVISEHAEISWNDDLSRIFFGLDEQQALVEKPEHPDRVANVDVWHAKDKRIQSVQMMQAEQDRDFTYHAAFLLEDERFVRLTDETMRRMTLTRDGRWGVGVDDRAYVSDWKEPQADYYRVDTSTGERMPMLQGQKRTYGISPDSRSFLYWHDENLWLYELESGQTRNLTGNAPISFVNREHDYPDTPPPYGVAAWTDDGAALVLNHRYDLWLQPLDGGVASSLTAGVGDSRELRFRHVRTEPGPRTVNLQEPLLLSAYGQWTKQAGFYRLVNGTLEQLVLEDRRYGRPLKAPLADVYLLTRETFEEFPDLWVTDDGLASVRRITEANPWQGEYRWGRRILFDFTNADGVRLQGTLAIPDDYVPGERRPMMVNFYEKNSQNLHRHIAPRYVTGFGAPLIETVSKGYLVMQPDIHFRTGNTHADMLECVEAATRKVIEMGYADPASIGLHGHSFSGQGSAYIAGNSPMFAAVAAGAAATDLLADFNHMWGWTPTNMNGSGANAHRYDYYGQGRLGTNPYDDRELYWRESPTNHVRTMDVPLLLMHGIADGVVGIMEAVQLYNGLRFNDKNVVLLSYPDEGHGLANLANRRDLTIRMQEFFDHYLMDFPAAGWMVDGVPFLKKEHGAWNRRSEQ